MPQEKLQIEDLLDSEDKDKVDVSQFTQQPNPMQALITEEVEEFLRQPRIPKAAAKPNPFQTVPSTALKSSIEELLKKQNLPQERLRKCLQHAFDKKMQRIKSIKSKTFRKLRRKEKLRQERALEVSTEDSNGNSLDSTPSLESSDGSEEAPVLKFEGAAASSENDSSENEASDDEQQKMVQKAFCEEEDTLDGDSDFEAEKEEIVAQDAPQTTEHFLPGWDDWAGTGIETKKTKYNTFVEKKDGIKRFERKDFGHSNVIINEKTEQPEKYKVTVPYGLNKDECGQKLRTIISPETNALRVFKRFINSNDRDGRDEPLGKNIVPREFEPDT